VRIHVFHKRTLRNVSHLSVSSIFKMIIAMVGMLKVGCAAPWVVAKQDYAQAWRESPEAQAKVELQCMIENPKPLIHDPSDENAYHEYAASFSVQLYFFTYRFFQQLYRTPSYIVIEFLYILVTY
jgi:hypothetical protein